MKQRPSTAGHRLASLFLFLALGALVGCQAPQFDPPPADMPDPAANLGTFDTFRIGDQVSVTLSSPNPDSPLFQPIKEAIKEDGTISVTLLGKIAAAGKTPGELQTELQRQYEKYYKNIIVTVLPAERFYYVSGEVKKPGPEIYLGVTDIIKAISAGGDFTDYANKKHVQVRRSNGHTEVINVQKIINGDAEDVPIYPGDKIMVKRRLF